MPTETPEQAIRNLFQALLNAFGPQNWWPAETRFEVVVGSVLVQNTTWTNAAKALARLRAARALNLKAMRRMPLSKLQEIIRPAGFFRQKSRTIKAFVTFIDREYAGSMAALPRQNKDLLRLQLLGISGIGPETADSILLYAAQHPVFVVDAYARRVFSRHQIISQNASYGDIQSLAGKALAGYQIVYANPPAHSCDIHAPSIMSRMPKSQAAETCNEMHGLLVAIGKRYCRKTAPDCTNCPLAPLLPHPVPGI